MNCFISVINVLLCFSSLFYVTLSETLCPSNDLISPCICNQVDGTSEISCENLQEFDIKNVFGNFQTKKFVFDSLIISNTTIESIDEKTFSKVGFKRIQIKDNEYLTTISHEAFNTELNLQNLTKEFIAINNPQLGKNQYDSVGKLFSFLKAFINIELIIMRNNGIESVPDDAFGDKWEKHLKRLKRLDLGQNSITDIGSYAFYNLKKLKILNLERNLLTRISPDAFSFEEDEDELLIDLSFNPTLDYIDSEVFGVKVTRKIDFNLAYCGLEEFNRNVFEPIIRMKGSINMTENDMKICDCSLRWLYEFVCINKKLTKIIESVTNLKCNGVNAKNIEENLKNCNVVKDTDDESLSECNQSKIKSTTRRPTKFKPKFSPSRKEPNFSSFLKSNFILNFSLILFSSVFYKFF